MQVAKAAPAAWAERRLRAVKIYNCRVYSALPETASVADVDTGYWDLRVEPIADDDLAVLQRAAAAAKGGAAAAPATQDVAMNGAESPAEASGEEGDDGRAAGGATQARAALASRVPRGSCAASRLGGMCVTGHQRGAALQVCITHASFANQPQQTDFGEPVLALVEPLETLAHLQQRCGPSRSLCHLTKSA